LKLDTGMSKAVYAFFPSTSDQFKKQETDKSTMVNPDLSTHKQDQFRENSR